MPNLFWMLSPRILFATNFAKNDMMGAVCRRRFVYRVKIQLCGILLYLCDVEERPRSCELGRRLCCLKGRLPSDVSGQVCLCSNEEEMEGRETVTTGFCGKGMDLAAFYLRVSATA